MKAKKIALIGSTHLSGKMLEHKFHLWEGPPPRPHVRLPKFDHDVKDGLELISLNRELIGWADEVHLFYDGRSIGTVFDFGMVFFARKPLRVIYMEPKTLSSDMIQYAKSTGGE